MILELGQGTSSSFQEPSSCTIPGAILWLLAEYARRHCSGRTGTSPILDRHCLGHDRLRFVYLVRQAVCDGRQGHSRALGSAGETGCPRPLPPCQKSHDYERASPPRRRIVALGLVAPGRLDVGLFPAQHALFPMGRGAGPGKAVRRQLSTLQGECATLDTQVATVGPPRVTSSPVSQ